MMFKLVKTASGITNSFYVDVEVRQESSNLTALFDQRITFIVLLFQTNTDAFKHERDLMKCPIVDYFICELEMMKLSMYTDEIG